MKILLALWQKEWLALLRDRHGLAALFVMPAVFILVMSLALRDTMTTPVAKELGYAVVDFDQSAASRTFIAELRSTLSWRYDGVAGDMEKAREAVREGRHSFVLILPKGYGESLTAFDGTRHHHDPLQLLVDPTVNGSLQSAFSSQVLATIATLRSNEFVKRLQEQIPGLPRISNAGWQRQLETVAVRGLRGEEKPAELPSAVQQSVPAWLIFSMFFVVIPISAVFITERSHGTLQRLRSVGVGFGHILAGKLLPFIAVNQVQAILMLGVGLYLVPLCGGEALALPSGGSAMAALWAMSLAVSLAAVAWALLIASLVRTSEQATVIGGVGNIIMGAIGGIMVPKFIMPKAMQLLTETSPMAWALEGFHHVLLRGGALAEVWPWAVRLIVFAIAAIATAIAGHAYLLRKRS